jgi:hypothetical protein
VRRHRSVLTLIELLGASSRRETWARVTVGRFCPLSHKI